MTWFQRSVAVVLLVYTVLLLLAVLSPSNSDQSQLVFWLGARLHGLGLPGSLTSFTRLEVVLNAAIVAPVSLLGSLLRPRWTWRDWTAWGFVAASAVEITQLLVLPGRQASFSDVVANTGGALLGSVVGAVVLLASRVGSRTAGSDTIRP